jgi:hypothetical protein
MTLKIIFSVVTSSLLKIYLIPVEFQHPPPNQKLTCTQTEYDIVEKEPQSPLTFHKKHPSGKHRVGLNKEWLKQYSWLYFNTEVDVDGNSQDVMLCRLCRKHQSHGSNGSQMWSNVGYKLSSCLNQNQPQS